MAIEKTKRTTIRWTPENLKKMQKRAGKVGVPVGRYIREVALGELPQDGDGVTKYDYTEVLDKMRSELTAIGNNLNQLTRVANQTGMINDDRLDRIEGHAYELKMRILDNLIGR